MKVLDRYIFRTILVYSLVAASAFIAISAALGFVSELDHSGRGNYGMVQVILFVVLQLPQRMYEFFPVMILLGCLSGLGALAAGSELIVIRSAGVSVIRIGISVLRAGIIMAVICFALGEWLAPAGYQRALDMRSQAIYQKDTVDAEGGIWLRDSDSYFHASRLVTQELLEDIRIFRFADDFSLEAALSAERALYRNGQWYLQDAEISEFTGLGVIANSYDEVSWVTEVDPSLVSIKPQVPESLPLNVLFNYLEYMERNELDSRAFELAFWRKLATPATVLVMVLLSIPFVMGPLRSTGTGQRLFIGIVTGVAYFLVNMIIASVGLVYGLSPFFAAWLPTLCLTVVAVIWLWQINSAKPG